MSMKDYFAPAEIKGGKIVMTASSYDDDTQADIVAKIEKLKSDIVQLDNVNLSDLDLSARAHNALTRHGIDNVGQVLAMSERELLQIKRMGKRALEDVVMKMRSHSRLLECFLCVDIDHVYWKITASPGHVVDVKVEPTPEVSDETDLGEHDHKNSPLDKLLQSLPGREERVIRLLYGIGEPKKPCRLVAGAIGVSNARVMQIKDNALANMMRRSRVELLRDAFEEWMTYNK